MIIAICGKKGHGKDEFAKAVRRLDPGYTVRPFAGPLRRICKEVFQVTDLEMNHRELKEAPFHDGEIAIDDYLEYLEGEVGFHIEPRGLVAHTPRQLLQFVGSDYVRSHRPRFWLDAFLNSLGHGADRLTKVLVPDCRFPNEVGLVRSMNGKIVRVVRTDAPPATDTHESENQLADVVPDFTVHAVTGDIKALERAAAEVVLSSLLVEGGNAH